VGEILGKLERYSDMVQFWRQVVTSQEKMIWPEDPDFLYSYRKLGESLLLVGEYPEAEERYKMVYQLEVETFGEDRYIGFIGMVGRMVKIWRKEGNYAMSDGALRYLDAKVEKALELLNRPGKTAHSDAEKVLRDSFSTYEWLDEQSKENEGSAERERVLRIMAKIKEKIKVPGRETKRHSRNWISRIFRGSLARTGEVAGKQ
jgi:hypothetical protein